MKYDDLPPNLAHLLSEVGVVSPKPEPKPIVLREYTYRKVELDENGEPPF